VFFCSNLTKLIKLAYLPVIIMFFFLGLLFYCVFFSCFFASFVSFALQLIV